MAEPNSTHVHTDKLNGAPSCAGLGIEHLLTDAHVIDQIARQLYGNSIGRTLSELRFGTHGSLSVDLRKGTFFDFENNIGGGLLDLINHKIGGSHVEAMDWLRREAFLGNSTSERPNGAHTDHSANTKRQIAATYDYVDEVGLLLFQVVRFEPKDFRQRRPDPKGGWIWNTEGVRIVPYRLPELLAAIASEKTVFVVEGEKDVDNLAKLVF